MMKREMEREIESGKYNGMIDTFRWCAGGREK
jgi:hypothetical protein